MKTNLLDGVDDVGRVNIMYWRAPTRLLNWVGSATGGPKVAETLTCVFTGVETSLQSIMPARSRKSSSTYCCTKNQKMVKRVEVLHDEFPLESRYGVL
jgi:hypothetical protein